MKIETDRVEFGGGVCEGSGLGSPIAMTIVNRDHQNWLDRMPPAPLPSPPAEGGVFEVLAQALMSIQGAFGWA